MPLAGQPPRLVLAGTVQVRATTPFALATMYDTFDFETTVIVYEVAVTFANVGAALFERYRQ